MVRAYVEPITEDDLDASLVAQLGGSAPTLEKVLVYRDGTNVYAIARDGTTVYSGADTGGSAPANRRAAIQAAIDHCAGTYTIGHGGGGVVSISDQLYDTDTVALELDAPGVSIVCPWGQFDRNGFTEAHHAFYGATIRPSGNIGNLDVQEGAGTSNEQPVLCIGKKATGSTYPTSSTTQNENNPHGARIFGLNIDLRNAGTSDGILICDTQFVTVQGCNIANADGTGGRGIVVLSTLAPDNGAHGTRIVECMVATCAVGIYCTGSGSTDSFITGCRILQCTSYSCQIGASSSGGGGWQISDCHMTAAGSGSNVHIDCSAPATIVNNYFDSTGSYHIVVDAPCTITANIIKSSGSSTVLAPIRMTNNGRKSVIVANVWQGTQNTIALVRSTDATVRAFRPIIVANQLGTGNLTVDGTASTDLFNFDDTVANNTPIFFETVTSTTAVAFEVLYVHNLSGSSGELWTGTGGTGTRRTISADFSNRTAFWGTIQSVVIDSDASDTPVAETASTRTTDFPPFAGADGVIALNVCAHTEW